jgi:hypothetical protein
MIQEKKYKKLEKEIKLKIYRNMPSQLTHLLRLFIHLIGFIGQLWCWS